jgi:hypothetical protein
VLALSKQREGHGDEAHQLARDAVALVRRSPGEPLSACRALSLAAQVLASAGHDPSDLAREWLDVARRAGDVYEEALALNMVALGQMYGSEAISQPSASETATATAEAALACAVESGSPSARAFSSYLTALTLIERDTARAATFLEDALQQAEEAGNDLAFLVAVAARGWLRSSAGDHVGAARDTLASVRRAFVYGHRQLMAANLWLVAASLASMDLPEPAAVLMGWVESVLAAGQEGGQGIGPGGVLNWNLPADGVARLDALAATLGAERYAALTRAGSEMSDEDVLRLAVEHIDAAHQAREDAGRGGDG